MSYRLTVANFLLLLEKENDWRTLGIFLDVEDFKLDEIERLYESKGIRRCKEELFKVLKRREEYPTWEEIAEALDNVGNHALAKEVREKYIIINHSQLPTPHEVSLTLRPSSTDIEACPKSVEDGGSGVEVNTFSPKSIDDISIKQLFVQDDIAEKLHKILSKFAELVNKVRIKLNAKKVSVEDLRCYFLSSISLKISRDITTIDEVFVILNPHFCFIRYYCLECLVDVFLKNCKSLKQTFTNYEKELEKLKRLAPIKSLYHQLSQEMFKGTNHIKLKLIGFWSNIPIESFEKLIKALFRNPEIHLGKISVEKGCILISWFVLPNVLIEDLVTGLVYSKEFMSSVGIISLVVCGRGIFKSDVPQDTNITIDNIFLKAVEVGSVDAVNLLLSVVDININDQIYTHEQVTPIFIACKNGHSAIVSALLEYGANPNIPRKDGTTPLMITNFNGHLKVMECLLKAGVDLDVQADDGTTAVYCASENGHNAIVSAILNYRTNPNIPTKDGSTPLMIASFNGHLEVVEYLLKAGVDFDAQMESGATAVYCASQNRHTKIVSALLQYGANPNIPTKDGSTPLMIASFNGHIEVVECLLKAGVDSDARRDNGATAVYFASHNGHTAIVSALLQYGVNPDIPMKDGSTPLMTGSFSGHLEVVECLLKVGVDSDARRDNGATAVYCASHNGHTAIVSALLQYGVNPDIPTKDGSTPLMTGSFSGHLEVVECLLKVGVDLDAQANDGATAVYCASQNGHTAIVSALLEYGANPNVMTKNIITPLMIASQNGHHKIIDLLWKYGAEVNHVGPSGDTGLHMACYRNHIKAVETLLSLGANPCIANMSGHTPVYYVAGKILTIIKEAISRYELYSTFDYNISTLSSLPQPSSLPTFDRSPLLSSYKSPNSSSDIIKKRQLPRHRQLQNLPDVQFSSSLHRSFSVGHMSTGGRSSVHSVGSRGSRGSVGSRCSAY